MVGWIKAKGKDHLHQTHTKQETLLAIRVRPMSDVLSFSLTWACFFLGGEDVVLCVRVLFPIYFFLSSSSIFLPLFIFVPSPPY
jgi:hypothetical protein